MYFLKICFYLNWHLLYKHFLKDEATFDRRDISKDVDVHKIVKKTGETIMWEQWAGVVQRGRPETLVLHRVNPKLTSKRAPGPGAIRRVEWKTLGEKLLKHRKVVLHTDSAKSYKLTAKGVIHDRVVHCKKYVKSGNKKKLLIPKYVEVVAHKLSGRAGKLLVKSGTQIIDRCWRFLKDRLQLNQHSKAGSALLKAKLRSAQYEYWLKNADLWTATGQLCQRHMRKFVR